MVCEVTAVSDFEELVPEPHPATPFLVTEHELVWTELHVMSEVPGLLELPRTRVGLAVMEIFGEITFIETSDGAELPPVPVQMT